jgi:6-phosphogluconolactonase
MSAVMSAVRTFADLDALTRAAAGELAAIAAAAIAERGRCHIALSGGSTPRRLFQYLAAHPDTVPWDRVELWWGDERCVPPDHADSNFGTARDLLIEPLRGAGLDEARVHRIHGELEPGASARAYEDELLAALGTPPVLDLALQGMGPDGHTASLFPGSPALDETRRWVVANPVTSPLVPGGAAMRITLTAPAINAARRVRFLAAGPDKAEALAAVLEGPRDPHRYPAQLVDPAATDVAWLVDTAAAARLGGAR